MAYTLLKESTYETKFANARSEHGWNVVESQPAVGSNVWMDASTVLASIPDRPPPVFAVIYGPDPAGFQYDCKKHRILPAWVGYADTEEDTPRVDAKVMPSLSARC